MERSEVIVHMYVSLDGKIDGRYMDEDDRSDSGSFYDTAIWEMGNANGNGRTTAEMYFANHEVDYSVYAGTEVPAGDFIIRDDYYWVIFDRRGRCNWKENTVDYGGKTARVLMVLTEKVRKEYLAYLREKKIPYIFAGKEDLDFVRALEKLKADFGIDTLVLCGGAVINGAFLKQNAVDRISLVIAPYVEGDPQMKCFAETPGEYVNTKFCYESMRTFADGGVQLVFRRKEQER